MTNFLQQLFGQKQNSQEQLRQAQANRRVFPPELENRARQMGFNSAEEMLLFEQARRRGGTVNRGRADAVLAEARRGLDRGNVIPWHPKNILQMIANKFEAANSR